MQRSTSLLDNTDHLLCITVHTDTVDGLLATATAPVVDRFGWTTFVAIVWTRVLNSVDITTGAFMTVNMLKTSLSHATSVLLHSVCTSEHNIKRGWWRRGVAVERRTRDREVVGSSLDRALRRKNSGQVSHT